jgi:protein-S-isoprenylcysteine O-methyltransferase Ste14
LPVKSLHNLQSLTAPAGDIIGTMRIVYEWLFPCAWLLWCLYWGIAAFSAKPARRTEPMASRLSHNIPLALGILLLVSPLSAGTALRRHFLLPSFATFWIAALCLLLGLGFSIVARRSLGGNWSSTVTLKQEHTLTRSGPYRIVRHPIYSGILLAVLGGVIARGEWRDLIALALFVAAFLRKIRIEERFMLAQFGDAYIRYQREVAALIPGLL